MRMHVTTTPHGPVLFETGSHHMYRELERASASDEYTYPRQELAGHGLMVDASYVSALLAAHGLGESAAAEQWRATLRHVVGLERRARSDDYDPAYEANGPYAHLTKEQWLGPDHGDRL